ncbi:hypothetical protein [Rhodoferax sp.]|uniref:hypothetical protein n=1 Tax=Rhodoferax sp. TaxID=50421 RepID=UPI00283C8EAD|nr:hypothetical protein [Rhodoferax sp.]MDR3369005.1 hypothetical protein [Rhodoferax sp.]
MLGGWNEAERETLRRTVAERQPFLDYVFCCTDAAGHLQNLGYIRDRRGQERAGAVADGCEVSVVP